MGAGAAAGSAGTDGAAAAPTTTTTTTTPSGPPRPAGWGRPFALARPVAADLADPLVAFDARGSAAISYDAFDEDDPALASAYALAQAASGGGLGPARRLPAVQQVLGLAFAGATPELLTGSSPPGLACCSSAEVEQLSAGGAVVARSRPLDGLAGASEGQLLELPGGRLAIVADQRGVWVMRAAGRGRYSAPSRLAGVATDIGAVAGTALSGPAGAVSWSATAPGSSASGPRIYLASASARTAPGRPRVAIALPGADSVDGLSIGSRGRVPTLAWVASWFDSRDGYHSRVFVADAVGRRPAAVALSPPGAQASSVSLAADRDGAQVITWRECATASVCTAQAALRPAGGRWGPVRTLGSLDATDAPVTAESSAGAALVGWVSHGRVLAAEAAAGARTFDRARRLSGAGTASNPALAFAPDGDALAVWTQGLATETAVAARLSS